MALADRCVQCGLCLPHCPTYRLDRSESESPRGRIALARALADGSLAAGPVADAHLDHCLGCRRCEAVCPAGVEYGALLIEARGLQRQRRDVPMRQRAIEWLAARPAALDGLLGAYRVFYPLVPKFLPRPPKKARIDTTDTGSAADRTKRVALFRGCIAQRYDAPVHAALATLCRAAGFSVSVPAGQTCCGALHAHAGNHGAAGELAQANRSAFEAGVPVLSSASGCHETLADALDGHAPVRDACTFLLQNASAIGFRPARMRVALHLPCTQRAVEKSDKALRTLLSRVPELDVYELPDTGCCGAAGTYMFDQPERAHALRQPLLDAIAGSGASLLLSANVGCRLHLANGDLAIPVKHPLEFLMEHLA